MNNNDNYLSDDIIIRKATLEDNFEEMAQLIYETDDKIYTYWFHDDVEEAKKVLPPLMKEEGFFYNYKSIYIAIDKNTNKIVGLICCVLPETNLEYDYDKIRKMSDSYAYTVDNYIIGLIEEVQELQVPYISNVAVHHDYRGRRIGSLMFRKVVEEKKPFYRKLLLDVLADNPSAIKLYENLGFEITSFYWDIGYGPGDYTETFSMELDNENKGKAK